jgi:uncharacterized protein
MPVNAGHEYFEAEKKYLAAQTLEEKIERLKELIKTAPKHKSSENLLSELKTRLKKFLEKLDKNKKTGKGKKGIRKDGYQVVLIGLTNSGKSLLLSKLTNATPKISENLYVTKEPEIGTMDFEGIKIQIVDVPSIGSKDFDSGIINNADCLLIVIQFIEDLDKIESSIKKNNGKKIIVVNKIDKYSDEEVRKIDARCKSKRLNCSLISSKTGKGILELKGIIFKNSEMIRVYTKEPGKEANKDPVVLPNDSIVEDVAESIYKGFSKQIKEIRLTGPSGKFSNQRVGLKHKDSYCCDYNQYYYYRNNKCRIR